MVLGPGQLGVYMAITAKSSETTSHGRKDYSVNDQCNNLPIYTLSTTHQSINHSPTTINHHQPTNQPTNQPTTSQLPTNVSTTTYQPSTNQPTNQHTNNFPTTY
jgi:hypothetical protein